MITAETLKYGFTPPRVEYIPHMKADAIRALSNALVEKLETGERFTVKLEKQEPDEREVQSMIEYYRPYGDEYHPPIFMYWLELGVVYERTIEIPVFEQLPSTPEPIPDYRIELTDSLPMIKELSKRVGAKVRYLLRWWTAAQVDADILAWRE